MQGCRAEIRGRGFVLPASSSIQLSSKGTGHSQVCPPTLGTDPHHPCRPCPLPGDVQRPSPLSVLGSTPHTSLGRPSLLSSPRGFLFKGLGAFTSERALLISSQSRRKLLATASDSSPGPGGNGLEGMRQRPGNALGHASCPQGNSGISIFPLLPEPIPAQGPAPASGENLAFWPSAHLLTQSCPVPPSLLHFALLGDASETPYTQKALPHLG